jgi:hypothetical protein
VVALAVGLHHQVQVGPVEIDPEAVDFRLGLGLGKTHLVDHAEEAALEGGIGEGESAAVEHFLQSSGAWPAPQIFNCCS